MEKEYVNEFDADLPSEHLTNRMAAEERKLRYDKNKKCYVDEDGFLIRDRFGQIL